MSYWRNLSIDGKQFIEKEIVELGMQDFDLQFYDHHQTISIGNSIESEQSETRVSSMINVVNFPF
jgi:hypothetical protein